MGFSISFTHPWLLFLLIPAAAVVLIPHLLIKKKYRRTRNRIIALSLQAVVLLLTVLVISGLTFVFKESNDRNEIILLVDVSDSQQEVADERDELVARIINNARNDGYKMGVVTFGFDQKYAVPMTSNLGSIYDKYLGADKPDASATDIAAALEYAKDIFDSSASSKIVLITDGVETDENALSVIRSISAQGISLDVAYVSAEKSGKEIQLLDVEKPNYHVNVGEECPISVSVQSGVSAKAKIELLDNDELLSDGDGMEVELYKGTQKITFKHAFASDGLHELNFKLTLEADGETVNDMPENNVYSTFVYLETFNKILLLESATGQSEAFATILMEADYDVTIMNVRDTTVLPADIEALRVYDQVIFNNISNSDLPEGFDELLYSYVYDYGGGLFTTGGKDASDNAHAYSRQDLYNTVLQEILPVQAIKYTPPLGLVIIIDRSGSMTAELDGRQALDWARSGAVTCLDNLTERDYIGVLTLDSDFNTILPMTPCTQQQKIRAAIGTINEANGNTSYPGAIDRAGRMLKALDNVEKRHIIMISDGEVPEPERPSYEQYIKSFYETDGITFSVVGIGIDPNSATAEKMKYAADLGHGRVHAIKDGDNFIKEMREELNVKEIKEVNFEQPFAPIINQYLSPVVNGVERGEENSTQNRVAVNLEGFYGVKAKSNSEVVLISEYGAPIYAQWKFGKGMVGSFMCDVYGDWSNEFINDKNGKLILTNAVYNLLPVENIRPKQIQANVKSDNYLNTLSVFTELENGEYIKGEIRYTRDGESVRVDMNSVTAKTDGLPCYVTGALAAPNNYSRCSFVVKDSGVYTIALYKYAASGNLLGETEIYKEFSYSKEYDANIDSDAELVANKLNTLAEYGGGSVVEDNYAPWEVFENFTVVLVHTYDPRMVLIITAIVLFLLGVAVRKFKFKWPHELIREYRAKKNGK